MGINQIKTTLLLAGLTSFFLLIGFLLGGITGITIAFILALLLNFLMYWYSDKIVLFMYRAKLASESTHPVLHESLRALATRSGLPKPKAYVVPSEQPNAFATGRNPKHATIAVTEGIMKLLNEDELKGVLAHEMAHIKNRDILISAIAATIAGAISYIAMIARFGAFFGDGREDKGGIVQLIILSILAPLIALIIRMAISRSREYLADETGARILRNPNPLAQALSKLNASSQKIPMGMGTEATSHLFIVNPFSGGAFMNMFQTHPSVASRIGKLKSMKF